MKASNRLAVHPFRRWMMILAAAGAAIVPLAHAVAAPARSQDGGPAKLSVFLAIAKLVVGAGT